MGTVNASTKNPLRWWVATVAIVATTFATPRPAFAQGLSGAYAPVHSQAEPFYFAGTNCRANGEVFVTQDPIHPGVEYLTHAELKVGGTVVREYDYEPLEPTPFPLRLEVVFDSTHFAPGSSVLVEISGMDSAGANYYDSYTVVTKNKLVGMYGWEENPTDSNAVSSFDEAFTSSGYSRLIDNGSPWDELQNFANLDSTNLYIVQGHGASCQAPVQNPQYYRTGLQGWEDLKMVTAWEAEVYQKANVGMGTPPWNATGKPPIQIAILYSCNLGDQNDFIRFCWPYYQWYGIWLEDQAILAFNVYVPFGEWASVYGSLLGSELSLGYSVAGARGRLAFESFSKPGMYIVKDMTNGDWRNFVADDLSICGDGFARAKGVYKQELGVVSTWYISQ